MPHAVYKATINAPFKYVSALLVDKMEWPRKYVGVILHSKIMERGEGYLLREMYQPPPVDLTIKERIYRRDVAGGEEFVYEHIDNAAYSGTFRNVLTRVPGRNDQVELEYVMAWEPHPGTADKMSDDQAARNVANGVHHLKRLAENPAEVPDWVRAFYEVVDAMGSDEMAPMLAEDVVFRMGNNPELLGRDAVVAGSRAVTKLLQGLVHDYVSVDQVGDKTFVDCWVTYTKHDGSTFVLPFLTVFERRDALISSVRIFGDMSPLRHGWPA